MRIPPLQNPARYTGLFVVDFGDSCSVGYTAEEVAMLLDSDAHAGAKVYRIHRATPAGGLELKGVSPQRFALETGMFLHHRDLAAARETFDALRALAGKAPPPCRARLFLAVLPEGSRLPLVVGLAYPAECDEDLARWLLDNDVRSGEYADGGIGRLEEVMARGRVIDSAQLRAEPARRSRSREEVLAAAGRPVQRSAG